MDMNKIKAVVAGRVIENLHDKGDTIDDIDLNLSITYLTNVVIILRSAGKRYDLAWWALNQDLMTLESYQQSRKSNATRSKELS